MAPSDVLVAAALERGQLTYRAPWVPRFEKRLSEYLGAPTLVCSSGTAAIHLSLMALGIKARDEVIIPDLTFATVASAVLAVGAKPVLADVLPSTTIDWTHVAELRTKRTKAVIAVHLYGEDAGAFAGLPVIYDNCEGLGYVPARGISCYSFYANKVITTGEGGAVTGLDVRAWRDGGHDENYEHSVPGLNYRMTAMQAAYGIGELSRIKRKLVHRNAILKQMPPGIGKWMRLIKGKLTPELRGAGCRPVFMPLHRQPWIAKQSRNFEVSDQIWREHFAAPPTQEALDAVQHVCRPADLGREFPKKVGPNQRNS